MFSSKLCHTEDGSRGKYPVKTCCMGDNLSGDMSAPSWPNLVFTLDSNHVFPVFLNYFSRSSHIEVTVEEITLIDMEILQYNPYPNGDWI